MRQNEFDISIRNLMAGAEESVSPEVWKGVEAGLDRLSPKRTVPVWLWRGLAVSGIAAAVAAAFVLLRPEKNLSNQPTIHQPVAQATDATLPAVTQPEEADVIPIEQQVVRLQKRVAQAPEVLTPVVTEEEENEIPVPETVVTEPERKPDAVIAPAARTQESFQSDEEAFRQLAFEEHKTRRNGDFSMSVLGNIQSNTRPESPTSRIRRAPSMWGAKKFTETGVDEGTEFSFGLPFSAGISLRYDFNPRWGIGTGLVYTNLSRSFTGNYHEVESGALVKDIDSDDITNLQHYIGVPVNVFFNIVNTGNWNVHVRMDGMAEKLIDSHFLIHDSEGDLHFHQKTDGLQFSTGVGVGVEFKFSPNVGLYFDPTIRYYFDCNQPRSIRTIQPVRMDIEAGLRFSLGQ